MPAKLKIEDCHNLAKLFGGKFLSDEYIDVNTKYLWECFCNKNYFYRSYFSLNLSIKKKYFIGCAECVKNHRKNKIEINFNLKEKRKNLDYYNNIAKEKGGEIISRIYLGCMKKHLVKCSEGHIWSTRLNDIKSGYWCPFCVIKTTKSTFQRKYGVNNSMDIPEVLEKIKNTNLKKYGVEYPPQNKEIALKTAKSSKKCYILYHWKTKEQLVCTANYEYSVVNWLNDNKIDFKWQPEVFITQIKTKKNNFKTYRPDLYLVKENKWIEIKGYFWKSAQEKWNWFHKEYPNSELWDEKKLKEMKIL